MWALWLQIKDGTGTIDFKDWLEKEHGFTTKAEEAEDESGYTASYIVVDKIVDEQKFAWFLLQC